MTKFSRRDFLKVAGLGSAAMLLAACGDSSTPAASGSTSGNETNNQGGSAAPIDAGTTAVENVEANPDVKYVEHIIYGDSGQVTAFNPQQGGIDNEMHSRVFNMVYNTLVYWNSAEQKLEEELATEWNYNDEGTEVTLKIRDDIYFHDGSKLVASDVEYSFRADMTKSHCTYIDDFEVISDTEIKIKLNKPNTEFVNMLSATSACIISQAACEADAENGAANGTGPWKYDLAACKPGDTVELLANEDYWGEVPVTKQFTFKYIANASSRLIALQNNEVQITYGIDFSEVSYAEEDPNITFQPYVGTSLTYFAFNTNAGPATDINLRKAIAYAVNREDLIAVVGDPYATPAVSLFNRKAVGYFTDFETDMSYDPEKAKEYVAKCGDNTHLTVMVNTSQAAYKSIIEVIQESCRQVGITIDVWEVDGAGLSANSKYASAQHEALVYGISMRAYSSDIARLLNPNLNSNKAIVYDEDITNLISQAVSTTDEAVQIDCYKQVQTIEHENTYYIPLYYGSNNLAYRNGMENVFPDVMNRHDFSYIRLPE